MWWMNIENESDIKKLAFKKYKNKPLDCLKKEINEDVEKFLIEKELNIGPKNTKKFVARGWRELSEKILKMQSFYFKLEGIENLNVEKKIEKDIKDKVEGEEIEYFKSKSDELIFYILELSGKKRNEKLGVKESYYSNRREARKWRNKILKEIHPDVCKNKRVNEANHVFEQLCELIIK